MGQPNYIAVDREAIKNEVMALVERCQAGESTAFDDLVRRYQRYVFNLIYQHLGSTDDMEDIAQEVFIRIFKFIKRFRREASLESWIYKIVLNYCRTFARRRKNWMRLFYENTFQGRNETDFEIMDNIPDINANPADSIEQQQTASNIKVALDSLPEIYREILIMREINELSYEEISSILDISIGTVKSRISRARDLVRGVVKP